MVVLVGVVVVLLMGLELSESPLSDETGCWVLGLGLKLCLASDLGRGRVHKHAGELGSVVGIVLRRVVAVHGGGDGDGSPVSVEIRDAAASSAVEASRLHFFLSGCLSARKGKRLKVVGSEETHGRRRRDSFCFCFSLLLSP